MTLPDALAWAEARTTDRWRMVAAQNPSNHGDLYAQMDAEAMDTLAEAAREREAAEDAKHEADLEQAFREGVTDIIGHGQDAEVNRRVAAWRRKHTT